MPLLVLACLAYAGIALPDSVLGIAWPSMSTEFRQPVGALGLLLPFGIGAAVLSSALTGRLLNRVRMGRLLSCATALSALGLLGHSLAPSLWAVMAATVFLGLGFGAMDSALNVYAASHFGARHINWMHASYGLGAVVGPAAITMALSAGIGWRWTYAVLAAVLLALAATFARAWRTPMDVPRSVAAPSSGTRWSGYMITSLSAAVFAIHLGIEGGIGLWAYVYLTDGKGLTSWSAGLAVSAYWAVLCLGRLILGSIAERTGPAPVLRASVVGMTAAAALMTIPAPTSVAVAGMLLLAVAAAPMFPLLILTTADRVPPSDTHRTIGIQIAASKLGATIFPALTGLLIQHTGPRILAPTLLTLTTLLATAFTLLTHRPKPPKPRDE
ncbi:MFS transporter [Streptomyces sp. NPDC058001]|uniref:MFS transporter n=1 Tax=Streptomyces sp. NPDC058001 TaxID=3346300 RepID=UPI0036EDFE8F